MKHKTRRTAAVTAGVVALTGVGVAFAAWTSTGTGSGQATATTAQNLTVTVAQNVTGLYPTGSKDVSFTVKNNNPYRVTLDSALISNLAVVGAPAGCSLSAINVTTPASLSDVLAAGATTSAAHVATISMGANADDGCQGQSFTFDVTVSGHSS
jgi:hypothetical protein